MDNGVVMEIRRFWVGVVGFEEPRHFSFNFKEEVRVERERKLLGHRGAKKENKKVSKIQRRFY